MSCVAGYVAPETVSRTRTGALRPLSFSERTPSVPPIRSSIVLARLGAVIASRGPREKSGLGPKNTLGPFSFPSSLLSCMSRSMSAWRGVPGGTTQGRPALQDRQPGSRSYSTVWV